MSDDNVQLQTNIKRSLREAEEMTSIDLPLDSLLYNQLFQPSNLPYGLLRDSIQFPVKMRFALPLVAVFAGIAVAAPQFINGWKTECDDVNGNCELSVHRITGGPFLAKALEIVHPCVQGPPAPPLPPQYQDTPAPVDASLPNDTPPSGPRPKFSTHIDQNNNLVIDRYPDGRSASSPSDLDTSDTGTGDNGPWPSEPM